MRTGPAQLPGLTLCPSHPPAPSARSPAASQERHLLGTLPRQRCLALGVRLVYPAVPHLGPELRHGDTSSRDGGLRGHHLWLGRLHMFTEQRRHLLGLHTATRRGCTSPWFLPELRAQARLLELARGGRANRGKSANPRHHTSPNSPAVCL